MKHKIKIGDIFKVVSNRSDKGEHYQVISIGKKWYYAKGLIFQENKHTFTFMKDFLLSVAFEYAGDDPDIVNKLDKTMYDLWYEMQKIQRI